MAAKLQKVEDIARNSGLSIKDIDEATIPETKNLLVFHGKILYGVDGFTKYFDYFMSLIGVTRDNEELLLRFEKEFGDSPTRSELLTLYQFLRSITSRMSAKHCQAYIAILEQYYQDHRDELAPSDDSTSRTSQLIARFQKLVTDEPLPRTRRRNDGQMSAMERLREATEREREFYGTSSRSIKARELQ